MREKIVFRTGDDFLVSTDVNKEGGFSKNYTSSSGSRYRRYWVSEKTGELEELDLNTGRPVTKSEETSESNSPPEVWISLEQGSSYEGQTIIGVSSNKDDARQSCQIKEDAWGDKAVNPLPWGEDYDLKAEGWVTTYYLKKAIVDGATNGS